MFARSSFISTKIVNKLKVNKLKKLYNDGKSLTTNYLNIIWNSETQKYANKDLYQLITENECGYKTKFRQICCKKAIDIKRSIIGKINKKLFILTKIDEDIEKITDMELVHKKLEYKDKINKVIEKINKKPEIRNFNLELNAEIIKINLNEPKKIYKNWIKFINLQERNFSIPFIKTKHFNKYHKDQNFKLSNYIQIYENGSIKVVFKSEIRIKKYGQEIGCDIGLNKVYSLSNGKQSNNDRNKNNLVTIITKICKTKNDSKANMRARTYRDNYIKESINQIDFTNVKTLYIENIKNIYFGKKGINRFLRSWRYSLIFEKLKSICEINEIKLISVRPTNTSRRCHICGWVYIGNRNKETFNCEKCNYYGNADINASKNILYIKNKKQILGNSNEGFWFH